MKITPSAGTPQLKSGKVLRVGQSLAQKAALLGSEGIEMPEMSVEEGRACG